MYTRVPQEIIRYLVLTKPIICFDYGAKKIGVAITSLGHRISVVKGIIREAIFEQQIKICCQEVISAQPCIVVVGLPLNMDGSFGVSAETVEVFAKKLLRAAGVPIFLQDERMTTKAADNLLRIAGVKRQDRNNKDDAIAASLILQTFIETLQHI